VSPCLLAVVLPGECTVFFRFGRTPFDLAEPLPLLLLTTVFGC